MLNRCVFAALAVLLVVGVECAPLFGDDDWPALGIFDLPDAFNCTTLGCAGNATGCSRSTSTSADGTTITTQNKCFVNGVQVSHNESNERNPDPGTFKSSYESYSSNVDNTDHVFTVTNGVTSNSFGTQMTRSADEIDDLS